MKLVPDQLVLIREIRKPTHWMYKLMVNL